jgi:hypothetical protein
MPEPTTNVYLGLVILACEVIWLYNILKPQFIDVEEHVSTNDLLLHRYVVNYIGKYVNAISPFDFFLPGLNTGFPLVSHYQHLPHVIVGVCNSFYSKINADIAILVLLSTIPFPIYFGCRKLGFNTISSIFMALLLPIINDHPPLQNRQQGIQYSYGIGINSQTHNGHGLFSQLLAIYLFIPGLGVAYTTIVNADRCTWRTNISNILSASTLISAIVLSNIFYGYMVLGSLCILEVIVVTMQLCSLVSSKGVRFLFHNFYGKPKLNSFTHFASIILAVALMISYFVIPFLKNRYVVNEIEHRKWKFDSVGWNFLYTKFVDGNLLDYGFDHNIITNFTFVGLIICFIKVLAHVVKARGSSTQYSIKGIVLYIWILASFSFWAIMFAGPNFLNDYPLVLQVLPFSSSLHFHRFISGMQIFAVFASGIVVHDAFHFVSELSKCYFCLPQHMENHNEQQQHKEKADEKNSTQQRQSCGRYIPFIFCLVIILACLYPSLLQRNMMQSSLNTGIQSSKKSQLVTSLEYNQIVHILEREKRANYGRLKGRIFTGMPGYRHWPIYTLFPKLLENDWPMVGVS